VKARYRMSRKHWHFSRRVRGPNAVLFLERLQNQNRDNEACYGHSGFVTGLLESRESAMLCFVEEVARFASRETPILRKGVMSWD